jgi:hypothetical protein
LPTTSSKSSSSTEKLQALRAVDLSHLFRRIVLTDNPEDIKPVLQRFDELDQETVKIWKSLQVLAKGVPWITGTLGIGHPFQLRVNQFVRNVAKNPNEGTYYGVFWGWPYHEYRRGFEAWLHWKRYVDQYQGLDWHSETNRYTTTRKKRQQLLTRLMQGEPERLLSLYQGVKFCVICGIYWPICNRGEQWTWYDIYYDCGTHRMKLHNKLTARELERLLVLKKAGAVRVSARGLPFQRHRTKGKKHGSRNV